MSVAPQALDTNPGTGDIVFNAQYPRFFVPPFNIMGYQSEVRCGGFGNPCPGDSSGGSPFEGRRRSLQERVLSPAMNHLFEIDEVADGQVAIVRQSNRTDIDSPVRTNVKLITRDNLMVAAIKTSGQAEITLHVFDGSMQPIGSPIPVNYTGLETSGNVRSVMDLSSHGNFVYIEYFVNSVSHHLVVAVDTGEAREIIQPEGRQDCEAMTAL